MFPSNSVICSYCILWISPLVPQVSTFSSKPTRLTRQKEFSPMSVLIAHRNWATKNTLHLTPSLTFSVTGSPLKKITTTLKISFKVVLSRQQALDKVRMDNVPPTVAEKYTYLQNIWDNELMQSFADFFNWYKNKDVVPTLKTMQKVIEFYFTLFIIEWTRGLIC